MENIERKINFYKSSQWLKFKIQMFKRSIWVARIPIYIQFLPKDIWDSIIDCLNVQECHINIDISTIDCPVSKNAILIENFIYSNLLEKMTLKLKLIWLIWSIITLRILFSNME